MYIITIVLTIEDTVVARIVRELITLLGLFYGTLKVRHDGKMICILNHDSTLVKLCWAGTTWANEMNHALGAGSIARPVDQQSIATIVPRMPSIRNLGILVKFLSTAVKEKTHSFVS